MKKVMVALVAGAMITALAACEKGNATGSRMGNNRKSAEMTLTVAGELVRPVLT